ncbi:MAG TPA: rhombosortase [Nevskiaceae bacterium]|nr:rhombosortase [Nevskiaceae bacterium]
MLLLLGTELLGDWGREHLRYDRAAIAAGQWWRFITGNFVHLGWYHWALNEAGIVVLVLLCPEQLSPLVWMRRVLLLCVGMSAGLYWLVPGLPTYVGMSGVIHGLFVLGLMPQVLKKDLIALGCLLYLLGKLGYELYAGAPVSDEHAIGGSVVTQAHFYGSISALFYGLVFRTYTRHETWRLKS